MDFHLENPRISWLKGILRRANACDGMTMENSQVYILTVDESAPMWTMDMFICVGVGVMNQESNLRGLRLLSGVAIS